MRRVMNNWITDKGKTKQNRQTFDFPSFRPNSKISEYVKITTNQNINQYIFLDNINPPLEDTNASK